jgi:hypothetical protein
MPRSGTRVVSVGGGPRGESQATAEMELLRRHRRDFERVQELGGKYDIQTVIVERRQGAGIGRGNAWGEEHGTGTANTGAESSSIGGYLDQSARMTAFITENRDALQAESDWHPVLETLLDQAFDGSHGPAGIAAVDRATMTRAQQGREASTTFQKVTEQTRKHFPFYKLDVLSGTSVEKIDLAHPSHPELHLVDSATGQALGELPANTVRLNTGTTLTNPLKDAAVRQHAYVGAMNPHAVAAFLVQRDLLDDDGQLRPGTKLALGGSGLSAYDQLLALAPSMQLFVRDDSTPIGYRVSDAAKRKYQGAISFISNTPGKWVPPRHSHGPAWKQADDPLGEVREQHALFLHRQGEEVFRAWGVLTDASVALSLGLVPSQVRQEGMSTDVLLQAQHANTTRSATLLSQAAQLDGDEKTRAMDESTRTLEGARRQAYLSTILGLGMSREPQQAIQAMSGMAPITFDGHVGYGIHRAQLKAISEPGTEVAADNAELFERFSAVMRDVTSSPMVVHDAVAMLFEAGIACHRSGSYDKLESSGDGTPLTFTAQDGSASRFDAFIVSPTFDRCKEPALMSLSGQVKPADPRIEDIGEVSTHRRIVASDGSLTQVEDHSLNGKGAGVPGTRSKTNVFSTDVNNRESAYDVAPGMAYRRMAREHLAAAGFDDPSGEVDRLYDALLPGDDAHAEEAARFAPHFDTAMIKSEFLKAAEHAAGDDAGSFAGFARTSRTASTVKTRAALFELPFKEAVRRRLPLLPPSEVVDALGQHLAQHPADAEATARHAQASEAYADGLAGRPAFAPASNADYGKRFVDLPLKTHQRVHARALEMAKTRLKERLKEQLNEQLNEREGDAGRNCGMPPCTIT